MPTDCAHGEGERWYMYNQHFFDKGLGLKTETKHKVNRLVMALSNYGLGVCCGEPRFLGEGDLDECLFGPVATCLRITLDAAHLYCYVGVYSGHDTFIETQLVPDSQASLDRSPIGVLVLHHDVNAPRSRCNARAGGSAMAASGGYDWWLVRRESGF